MLKLVTKEVKHVIEYMGAKFEVIPNTKERHKELIEKHTYMKPVKKGPHKKTEYVEAIDFTELLVDRIDTQVTGWSGISGNPECNSENKRALAIRPENNHICTYLMDEIDNIGVAIQEAEEKKTKN